MFTILQIVKSSEDCTETALDEIKLLKCVREGDTSDPYRSRIVTLLDDFTLTGINGKHVCMVFEVQGHNLLKILSHSRFKGLPLTQVRLISQHVYVYIDSINLSNGVVLIVTIALLYIRFIPSGAF